MIAHNYLSIIAIGFVVVALGNRAVAADDVTIVSPPSTATTSPSQKQVAADGTPIVHKSLHKKKSKTSSTAAASATSASSVISASPPKPAPTVMPTLTQSQQTAPVKPASASQLIQLPISPPPSLVPTVETGLPIARHNEAGNLDTAISTSVTLSGAKPYAGTSPHQTLVASALPPIFSMLPTTSSTTGSYSSQVKTTGSSDDFVFANFSRKIKNVYPWKTGIVTTMFWIGEGSTPISSTTNEASSWDEDWMPKNHGSDSPYNRSGYASGNHASTLNPFYVALPFNDLAFPDKARRWLPAGWYRHPVNGKQVSACKDRWVEIKNQRGDYCFAQWEDVGPLTYEDAEYVFGSERPQGLNGNQAGLDVSPAVADYLGIDGKNRITSWRFVDDEDVRPGDWLKLDEQAVLFSAMQQMKGNDLPIQKAAEPIDDPSNDDANKKKVGQAKG